MDGAGVGTCEIWYIRYEMGSGFGGNIVGNNLTDLTGCFALSNPITVIREAADGGTVSLADGTTSATIIIDGIPDPLEVEHITTAPNLTFDYVITDDNDIILAIAADGPIDLDGAGVGVCRIWGWSYRGLDETAFIGLPLADLQAADCSDISSNFITVNRLDDTPTVETFTATLTGSQEIPCPVVTPAYGAINAELDGNTLTVTGSFTNLAGDFDASIAEGSHIHFAPAGRNGDVEIILAPTLDNDLRGGTYEAINNTFELTNSQVQYLRNRELYVNIHTTFSAPGELRGQIIPEAE